MNKYNVIVIGAGHAGCEASLACARMGLKTLIITMQLDAIARMSCNPAIGGIAKGQIVRDIDALGGEMGKITDIAGIQFRMLNKSRGPAVWSPRAQCDKNLYHLLMKESLEKQENLDIIQDEAKSIILENNKIAGIETKSGIKIISDAVILTTGTFLKGLIHLGLTHFEGGRFGEAPSNYLSDSLSKLGFEIKRLKTGTPPRINGKTIDFSKMSEQPGDQPPIPFSHFTDIIAFQKEKIQLPCWLTYTNEKTHEFVRKGLDRSPLYTGVIKSIGPRYCPSIEDKVVRFSERGRHQVFLEPEGYNTNEYYANGISTSLPDDIQENIVHSISGLENAKIMRYGYAIEYDFCPPTQLYNTLETKLFENLYFAGQINGTTGYEEAAAQGFMAGVNAGLKIKGKESFVLSRDESYIGVLIDDLTTKGVDEPYRMFTSRSEYRLILRFDNADLRLMDSGHKIGLISDKLFYKFEIYKDAIIKNLASSKLILPEEKEITPWTIKQIELEIEIEKKYSGYIKRQTFQAEKMKKMEEKSIPGNFDYKSVPSLLTETRIKLSKIKPKTLGQALRVPGVTPADIAVLLIFLEREKYLKYKEKHYEKKH
ncbi:MAG: tRNA uridine-5-carboxymethylaminomethyl(34) synthesis enzyme MnmG [Elusimicrobia bacterium]|nr:tRNA uridine-5-carboxymethylaminomethyl(34) synthesis enzyme MnmG [Elusimicrobiota bacterium]